MNKIIMRSRIRETLVKFQENKCAVCGITFSEDKRPYMDHNHQTCEIRGAVCYVCNTRIGQYERNAVFKKATMSELTQKRIIEYLKLPPATHIKYLLNNPHLLLYQKEKLGLERPNVNSQNVNTSTKK